MNIAIDSKKAKKAAELLYKWYSEEGMFGHREMPEDLAPAGVVQGSLEHIMFITLTVSIDYQRDAISLWNSSRKTCEDSETNYLYSPKALYETSINKIIDDMNKYGLSKKHTQDAWIWRTVGVTFYKKWESNPVKFLSYCDYDAPEVIKMLKESIHINNGKNEWDFPFLRGDKIGPLWIKMLRDNVGIKELKNIDKVTIPVDIHVARSSLALGVVKGSFRGRIEDLFKDIRCAWFEGVKGLSIKGRPMVALDIDEPLWHLSKYGCAKRNSMSGECAMSSMCKVRDLCMPGQIKIESGKIEMM